MYVCMYPYVCMYFVKLGLLPEILTAERDLVASSDEM